MNHISLHLSIYICACLCHFGFVLLDIIVCLSFPLEVVGGGGCVLLLGGLAVCGEGVAWGFRPAKIFGFRSAGPHRELITRVSASGFSRDPVRWGVVRSGSSLLPSRVGGLAVPPLSRSLSGVGWGAAAWGF